MSQHLDSNFVIADYWARPSSTTLMLAYDSTAGTLEPFEHLYIDNISATSATVSGYWYEVLDPIDSYSVIGYWGADSVANFNFDYTLLLNNPTVSCNPIDTTTTRIKEIPSNQLNVLFYPNPVQDAGILQIFTDADTKATIDIVDQQGRKLETIFNGDFSNGSHVFNIDTKPLSSGIYMIIVNSEEGRKNIKFTKL
jgi:hypothetical protein